MAATRIEPKRGPQERAFSGVGGVDEHLVSLVSPATFPAEQYRALRHFVEEMRRERGLQVFAVTSPSPGDGKTTTAINLAGALASAPYLRVVYVEDELRRYIDRVYGSVCHVCRTCPG